MDYKYKIFSTLILIAIAIGCGQRESNNDELSADRVITCEFSKLERVEQIKAIFKSATIIPLEQNDDSMISSECEIIEHNGDYIFVNKQQRRCIRFDQDGKYKNHIGRSGRASDEYLDIADVQIDGEHILIYSNTKASIYKYSLSGDFIESVDTGIRAQQLLKVGDTYFGYFGYDNGQQKERLMVYDTNFKVLNKLLPSDAKLIVFSESISPLTLYNGDIYIRETYNRSIHKISKDGKFSTPLEFDFGSYNIPSACFNQSDAFKAAEMMISRDFASMRRFIANESNFLVQVYYQILKDNTTIYDLIGVEINGDLNWITATSKGSNAILFSSVRQISNHGIVTALVDQDIVKEFNSKNAGFIENIDILPSSNNNNPVVVKFNIR